MEGNPCNSQTIISHLNDIETNLDMCVNEHVIVCGAFETEKNMTIYLHTQIVSSVTEMWSDE